MHNDVQIHLLKVTSHRLEQQNVNEYKPEGQECASAPYAMPHRRYQLHYQTSPIVHSHRNHYSRILTVSVSQAASVVLYRVGLSLLSCCAVLAFIT